MSLSPQVLPGLRHTLASAVMRAGNINFVAFDGVIEFRARRGEGLPRKMVVRTLGRHC